MAGSFKLIGANDKVVSSVHTPSESGLGNLPGLVAYTHSLETGTPLLEFFADETGSINQNINASGSGTLLTVHDGGDTTLWTANAEAGTWDFASTTQANTGSQSIELGTRNGDTASFTWPSPGDLFIGGFTSLRGYIFVTSWPNSGSKDVTIQLHLNGASIGTTVNLSAYIDTSLQDTWQLFEIPLVEFQTISSSFDAVWVSMVDAGQGAAPSGFLDDIAFVQAGTGGVATFKIQPPLDEVWVINRIKWTSVATNSSIKPSEFFGIAGLTNGYQLAFRSKKGTLSSFTAQNFFDIARFANTTIDIISGTNSIYEVYFDIAGELQTLDGAKEQSIELIVRDDLSSMTEFVAAMQGYSRKIV